MKTICGKIWMVIPCYSYWKYEGSKRRGAKESLKLAYQEKRLSAIYILKIPCLCAEQCEKIREEWNQLDYPNNFGFGLFELETYCLMWRATSENMVGVTNKRHNHPSDCPAKYPSMLLCWKAGVWSWHRNNRIIVLCVFLCFHVISSFVVMFSNHLLSTFWSCAQCLCTTVYKH